MKGGSSCGLRVRQLSVLIFAVVSATIIIWRCDKSALLISFLPPQSRVLQLPPVLEGEELKHQQSSDGEKGKKQKEISDNSVAAADSTNKSISLSGKGMKNSKTTAEKRQGSQNLAHYGGADSSTSVIEGLDFKQVSEGRNNSKEKQDMIAPKSSVNEVPLVRREGNISLTTDEGKQACNFAKGKWVTDDSWPLYSGFGCKKWLSGMWACRLTQRIDFVYEKLRWLPKDCAMESFTRSKFLTRMQNKTLAFVGDSLGRQQFQSLMCMITGGEERPDVVDVGRDYGLVKARGAVRPDGWAYLFPSTNTTVLYYWSASLCDLEPLDAANPATDYAMHLDRPPAFLSRFLHKFDVLVLNTGHHWNRGKLRANRWVIHVGGVPNTNRKIAEIAGAKNFTIYSIVNWVNSQLPKHPGLKAFYRSISPRHFFNGDWDTGGTCDNTTPLSGGKEVLEDESSDPLAAGAVKGTRVKLLDVTALSQLRDEGHISRYSIKASPGMQDCLHWCLPGVPDAWNEILFAQL